MMPYCRAACCASRRWGLKSPRMNAPSGTMKWLIWWMRSSAAGSGFPARRLVCPTTHRCRPECITAFHVHALVSGMQGDVEANTVICLHCGLIGCIHQLCANSTAAKLFQHAKIHNFRNRLTGKRAGLQTGGRG